MQNLTEKQLHKQICDYLKLQYPNVLFNTDLSGIKLSIGQAKQLKHLRSSKGFPDIVIYELSFAFASDFKEQSDYYALFLEVKKESPFKKDGSIKKNNHLIEQWQMINDLNSRGYKAAFVWTFDIAKKIIDNYLR